MLPYWNCPSQLNTQTLSNQLVYLQPRLPFLVKHVQQLDGAKQVKMLGLSVMSFWRLKWRFTTTPSAERRCPGFVQGYLMEAEMHVRVILEDHCCAKIWISCLDSCRSCFRWSRLWKTWPSRPIYRDSSCSQMDTGCNTITGAAGSLTCDNHCLWLLLMTGVALGYSTTELLHATLEFECKTSCFVKALSWS